MEPFHYLPHTATWHLYHGDDLLIHIIDDKTGEYTHFVLGSYSNDFAVTIRGGKTVDCHVDLVGIKRLGTFPKNKISLAKINTL